MGAGIGGGAANGGGAGATAGAEGANLMGAAAIDTGTGGE